MRREFTAKTKALAFQRANGRCEGENCGARLTIGKYHYDHVIADCLGGEPVLSNIAVLCIACHREKTKADVKHNAKARRRYFKEIGAKYAPYRPIQSAPFQKREKRSKALTKQLPPRRLTV